MDKHKLFIVFLGIFCLLIIGVGFIYAGNPFTQRLLEYDRQRIEKFKSIKSEIERYFRQNNRLPSSLLEAAVFHDLTIDPQTKKPFDYRVIDNLNYQLCAVFSTGPKKQTSTLKSYDAYMSLSEQEKMFRHQKGYYCIELKIPDSIKSTPTPQLTRVPTPTPIEIQNVNSNSQVKKWTPYFYEPYGLVFNIPDGWDIQIGHPTSTLPKDALYISKKSNKLNRMELYSVSERTDLSLEDHIREITSKSLQKNDREGEHSLNYLMIQGNTAIQLVTLVPANFEDATSGIQNAVVKTLFEINDRWFLLQTNYSYRLSTYPSPVINMEEELELVVIYKKILLSMQPIKKQ